MGILTPPRERGKEAFRLDGAPPRPAPQSGLGHYFDELAAASLRFHLADRQAREAQVTGDAAAFAEADWLRDEAAADYDRVRGEAADLLFLTFRCAADTNLAALSALVAALPPVAELVERVETLEAAVAGLGVTR